MEPMAVAHSLHIHTAPPYFWEQAKVSMYNPTPILVQSLSHYGGDGDGDGGHHERTQYIWSPWTLPIRLHIHTAPPYSWEQAKVSMYNPTPILVQSLSHYGGDGDGDGGHHERTQYIWSPWPLPIGSIYIRLHRTFGNKQRCRCTILLQSCYNHCHTEETEETRGRNIYGAYGRCP